MLKSRLAEVLKKLDLPRDPAAFLEGIMPMENAPTDAVMGIIMNDKKAAGGSIDIAQVDEIGWGHIETWSIEAIRSNLQSILIDSYIGA